MAPGPAADPAQSRPADFSYTDAFARYASDFRLNLVPKSVRQQARAVVPNTLGAMLAAASPRYPIGQLLGGFVERSGGTPEATLVGRGTRSSIVQAALYNGTLGYYCDVESHHPGAIMHGPAIVVPTSLAMGEARGLSGAAWLAAVEDGTVDPNDVASIVLRFSHSGRSIIDNNELRSHCAQYILPIGLHNGTIVIDDILQDRRTADVAALAEQVQVVGDDALEQLYPDRYASIVELTARSGTTVTRRVDWPRGYPQNPVSQADIEQKFLSLATTTIDRQRAERVVQVVGAIEEAPDLSELLELIGPAA